MDEQLDWIVDVLESYNIPFWVDAGTLLGLYRDNQIIPDDDDLDLRMWYTDKPQFENLFPIIRQSHYRIIERRYHGVTSGYKLQHRARVRPISIKLMHKYDDVAWTWESKISDNPYASFGIRYLLHGIPRFLSVKYQKLIQRLFDSEKRPLPIYDLSAYRTWWVPLEFYSDLTTICGYPAPSPTDSYLEYKYGDWETPDSNWHYWRDDKSLREEQPFQLIEYLQKP